MDAAWLDQLRPDELERLRGSMTRQHFAAGDLVLEPDAATDWVFFLSRGLVRVYRSGTGGRVATLGYVSPGEVFGELGFLLGVDGESYARAVRASLVLRVCRDTFGAILSSHPSILAEVTRQVASRLKRLENRCEDLILRGTRERLAHFLLELSSDFAGPAPEGVAIDLRVNQADLATAVGATRQSVNVCLREMKAAGLIEYERGHLTILRPDVLRAGLVRC